MVKRDLNENLLDELKLRVPNYSELVSQLGDILSVGKEAIYRRLRGEVQFSLEEASLISYHMGLSLDSINGLSSLKRPFTFKMANYAKPKEVDYKLINEFVDFLDYIKDNPDTEMGTATKLIPDALHLNYQYITRFYLFKWIYQYDNDNNIKKYQNVVGSDRLLEMLQNLAYLTQHIKKAYYIFDQRIFENIVSDIKYFRSIGLITSTDIKFLKDDLYMCLDDIMQKAAKGVNQLGNKIEIYLSHLNFEAGFSYIKSENYKLSAIRAFTMYDITSIDIQTYDKSLKWMQSLKRASSLISESGEIDRMIFFNAQREIISTL